MLFTPDLAYAAGHHSGVAGNDADYQVDDWSNSGKTDQGPGQWFGRAN